MRSLILFCLLSPALLTSAAFAQKESQQWEYLEVDGYTSRSLNELGKKGWELVVFGRFEGAPVKFIFKRPFDAERSRMEAENAAQSEPQQARAQFIDLDFADAVSDRKERERRADEKIEQAIRKIKGFAVVSVKPASWFPSANDRRARADVVIDASKELLKDGNKYRSSEAAEFIRRAALEIYKAAELKPKYQNQEPFQTSFQPNLRGVNIKLSVIVSYNGNSKTVAEGAVVGD